MKLIKDMLVFVVVVAFSLLANITPSYSQLGADVLSVTPAQLDFGTVSIRSNSFGQINASRMSFIVENTSNSTLRLLFSRLSSSPFRLDKQVLTIDVLKPGEERSFGVSFNPKQVGVFNAILIVTAERVAGYRNGRLITKPIKGFSQIMPLIGRASEPGVRTNTDTVDFGETDVPTTLLTNQSSISNPNDVNVKTLTVANTSNVRVRGTLKFKSNVFFFADILKSRGLLSIREVKEHRKTFTLEPNEVIEIQLVFLPDQAGAFTTTAILEFNARTDNRRLLNLKGEGRAAGLSVSTTHLDFGNVRLGDRNSRTIVFRNAGNQELRARLQSFCPEFSITNSGSLNALEPGQSVEIKVELSPTRIGRLECLLLVESNDPNTPTVRISVSATITRSFQHNAAAFDLNAVQMVPALGGGFALTARGVGIASIQLQVFDLRGRLIYDSTKVPGQLLNWQGSSTTGQPLVNGAYLYVVTMYGFNGEVQRSEIRKLAILK